MAYTTIDNPELFFQTKTYTGTGSARSITLDGSEDMQPDWVWIKSRSNNANPGVFDSVRGATKLLSTPSTDAESTVTVELTSFNSDGFSLGDGSQGYTNQNSGRTYVAWNWKAGGSASSNSNGSITSSVSANTTAGFSVGTYSANATAGATVGHGLGVAPDWLIVKVRNATNNWVVFHKSLGATKAVYLDQNSGQYTDGWMNNTAPNSSVFTLSGGNYGNASGYNVVFYAFAEKKGYSKFGSYTGNGNTNGTMIYTGFRPSFVLIKNTSASEHWRIYDNKRDTYNHMYHVIYANESSAESTVNNASEEIDFLSNGIKIRSSAAQLNGSGNELIYMAFAESPLVNSNSVPANAR